MRRRFKVVVVDDERESLQLIAHALSLSRASFDVAPFTDAEAALEYLRTTHVDLIVTDLRMPGMNGPDFIREFRQIDRHTPVVLASSEPILADEALAFGATAFVPKDSLNAQLGPLVLDLVVTHHMPFAAPRPAPTSTPPDPLGKIAHDPAGPSTTARMGGRPTTRRVDRGHVVPRPTRAPDLL